MLHVCICFVWPDYKFNPKLPSEASWSLWRCLLSSPISFPKSQCSRKNFGSPHTHHLILYSPFNLSYLCIKFMLSFCSLLLLTDISIQLLYFKFLYFLSSSLYLFLYLSLISFHLNLLTSFMLCFKRTCMLIENTTHFLVKCTSFF